MGRTAVATKEPPKFLRVADVAAMLDISESHAYKIMRQLNKELEAKGKRGMTECSSGMIKKERH